MEKLQNNSEIWKKIACDMQQLRVSQPTPPRPLVTLFALLLLHLLPPLPSHYHQQQEQQRTCGETGVLLQKYSKMVE